MSFNIKELKCFERPPKFKKRMALMMAGVVAMGFGLSILRLLSFGTDPCSCFTQGVEKHLPFSFGTCQLLCHLVTFAFVIKLDISKIGFGTVGNMLFLGYISDFFQWLWAHALPDGFFEITAIRYVVLLPTLAVFLIGAAAYMCAGLGSSPYDALPFIISGYVKRFSFKTVRILWDVAFMIGGFVLGGDVGIVTIAVAFFLGPVITWVQKKMEVLIA